MPSIHDARITPSAVFGNLISPVAPGAFTAGLAALLLSATKA
jgi:hypothetical protein